MAGVIVRDKDIQNPMSWMGHDGVGWKWCLYITPEGLASLQVNANIHHVPRF